MGNHNYHDQSKIHPTCLTFQMWHAAYGDPLISPNPSTVFREFLLEFSNRKNLSAFVQETHPSSASPIEILSTFHALPVIAISASYSTIEEVILPDSRILRIFGNSPLYLCAESPQKIRDIVDFTSFDNSLLQFTGKGVRVALIDTGIFSQHPDLTQIEISQIDATDEKNVDPNGHGTFLASLIAGSGKASHGKYRGIAPEVRLLDIKVFDQKGKGSLLLLLRDLESLMELPAENLPHIVVFGGLPAPVQSNQDEHEHDLLSRYASLMVKKGIAVVAPTGNFGPDGVSICSLGLNPDVLCVGGMDSGQNLAFFSGRSGRDKPDLVLPAVNMIGVKSSIGCIGKAVSNSNYIHLSGTSISAAIASGMLALLKQYYPEFTPHQLYKKLLSSAPSLNKSKGSASKGIPDLVAIFKADGKLFPKPLSYMAILKQGFKFALYFVALALLAFYFF
ncbi:MAG: S8 family serine peptidase [Promethearchaeota archaeon]